MKTIAELNKERLIIRTSNPDRSKALIMLIDTATKIAKSQKRSVTEADIIASAKKCVSSINNAIDEIKKKRLENNITTPIDFTSYEAEINLYKEFLPVMNYLSVDEMANELNKLGLPLIKGNKNEICKAMKVIPNMNMAMMSDLLNDLLK